MTFAFAVELDPVACLSQQGYRKQAQMDWLGALVVSCEALQGTAGLCFSCIQPFSFATGVQAEAEMAMQRLGGAGRQHLDSKDFDLSPYNGP